MTRDREGGRPDPAEELEDDRRFERGLLLKQLAVLVLIAALVVLRIAFAR
jgi:hypothetical protein